MTTVNSRSFARGEASRRKDNTKLREGPVDTRRVNPFAAGPFAAGHWRSPHDVTHVDNFAIVQRFFPVNRVAETLVESDIPGHERIGSEPQPLAARYARDLCGVPHQRP